jgi:GxxExxY protein
MKNRKSVPSGPGKQDSISKYEADFYYYDKIIVELRAVREIHPAHKAQLLNYLTATGYRLGLLVNFHASPKDHIIRIVR